MFYDQQRMACIKQFAQRTHEFGDIVKVQSGGGLVEHEQGATFGQWLAAGAAAAGCLGQVTGQLEALRLTAGQGGYRLAEFDVFQPHIDDRLQGTDHVAVGCKDVCRLAHRQVQNIRHVEAQQP